MAEPPGPQREHPHTPMASPTPPGLVTSGRHIPPGFPEPRVIEWAALQNLQLLRHGTGTSVYSATLEGEPVVVKTPATGLKPEAIFDVVSNCDFVQSAKLLHLNCGVLQLRCAANNIIWA